MKETNANLQKLSRKKSQLKGNSDFDCTRLRNMHVEIIQFREGLKEAKQHLTLFIASTKGIC